MIKCDKNQIKNDPITGHCRARLNPCQLYFLKFNYTKISKYIIVFSLKMIKCDKNQIKNDPITGHL